jgi:hypothetical protein
MEVSMKTRFKQNRAGLIGKLDDMVYFYHPQLNEILARKYTEPKTNPSAVRMKSVMANLKLINPSEGYKQNIRDYLILYNKLAENRDKPAINWVNIYLKMLFAMVKVIPDIDLATLNRGQIIEQNLPCRSLNSAIDFGLLPKVRDYERFSQDI